MHDYQIATNKKGLFNYKIIDHWEAGIKLTGPEVKSVKNGQINLTGSFISLEYHNNKPQLVLKSCKINAYQKCGYAQRNYNPERTRSLLLKRKELSTLAGKLSSPGLTIIPLSVYTKQRLIKIEIGLAQGLTKFDKRDKIKKRELDRNIQRSIAR